MDEYKYAKKLDAVLVYMAKLGQPRFQTGIEIRDGLQTQKTEWAELYLIMNKLAKDEYVEIKINEPVDIIPPIKNQRLIEYIITFDGLYHVESGGYLQLSKNNHALNLRVAAESKRTKNIETNQMAIQKGIRDLTFWIAVAAIISGGYYLYLLFEPICDFFLKK